MDKEALEKLYKEKLGELEIQRGKLGEMFDSRMSLNQPLTDAEIVKQNEHCGELGLEILKLKEMLKEEE